MKNYNKLSLEGFDITDAEVVEKYNLDPALVGKPEINDAMLDLVYDQNVQEAVRIGMPEKEAKAKAGANRAKAKAEVVRLMKEHK